MVIPSLYDPAIGPKHLSWPGKDIIQHVQGHASSHLGLCWIKSCQSRWEGWHARQALIPLVGDTGLVQSARHIHFVDFHFSKDINLYIFTQNSRIIELFPVPWILVWDSFCETFFRFQEHGWNWQGKTCMARLEAESKGIWGRFVTASNIFVHFMR